MALIVDKHRPRSLDALTYHSELSDRLRSLVRTDPRPPATTPLPYSTNTMKTHEPWLF